MLACHELVEIPALWFSQFLLYVCLTVYIFNISLLFISLN